MLLEKRVALVTGGAMGIGKAIAEDMAKEGARVVVLDIEEKEGVETVEGINKAGGEALFLKCDVTNLEELEKVAEKTAKDFGSVDILVVNAGISMKKSFEEIDQAIWDHVINTNLTSSFLTIKAFIDQVKESQFGKVIFITSASAFTGTGGGIYLSASKAGQNAMTLNLAKELGPLHINVNAIAPRVIQTKILDNLYPDEESREKLMKKIPIRKIGQVEDVAYLASFLASDKAAYINGQIILLDGGRTYQ